MNLNDLVGLSLPTIFQNIANAAQPLTGVIVLLILTALADVATGLYAAAMSHTLDVAYIDSFLTSHVATRWAPILGSLIGGIMIGGVDNILGASLIAAATAQIVAYEVATFGGSVPLNLRDASTKNKGLPGQTALMPGSIASIGTFEPTAPPPPPPLTVTVNGAPVAAHRDGSGKIVID